MRFYLQQGHGMMALNREFAEHNPGTGVILSPRNCTREQLERHAQELHDRNSDVLFDPQFYQPRTERENILNYPYWEGVDFNTHDFAQQNAATLCERVIRYQVDVLHVKEVILPGRYSNAVSEDWLNTHYAFSQTAHTLGLDRPVYCTLALGPDVILDRESFDRVLNEVVNYPVEGVYFVAKSPRDFLVLDELFLYNMLDGMLSISLSGKKVILGYANQQSLIFAAAGVTGLASGNFRNVRSFNPDTFDIQESSDMQRATWYYDANTLSEYRLQTLGLAYQRGLSSYFGPTCQYCSSLLESANPASVRWGENPAFRHYLTEIKRQWTTYADISSDKRIDWTIQMVNIAHDRVNSMSEQGLHPGERSFRRAYDPTMAALMAFRADRGGDLALLD